MLANGGLASLLKCGGIDDGDIELPQDEGLRVLFRRIARRESADRWRRSAVVNSRQGRSPR